ncbi:hypothetical protein [Thaumasiovibrio subtropicus]|uniref:hypothetical protein n=1 Tax=Thaumasiovibrio subtropicus TaxID=1891207 RepID=UPI000B35876C|nr:hypothetical protein [Thaumasiovibrio subtropicus]
MKLSQKVLLYIYSTPHLVGCCFALLVLAVYFAGFLDRFLFFILVGSYAAGTLITPQNRGLVIEMTNQMTTEELSLKLSQLLESAKSRLSEPVQQPLSDIEQKVEEILPLLDKTQVTHEMHTVKQVIIAYLPDMLSSYLKLPPAYARFHQMSSGKTPRDELIEQLALLNRELEDILGNLLMDDVNALKAHGQFLADKYDAKYRWI